MVIADCHVHTTNSDGRLTLDALPAAASRAGVEVVAVTDHDRLHPDLDAPVTDHDDCTVVHGIELRVDAGDQRLDLLAFGVERTEALVDECDRLQRDRVARGRAIIERVEARLDVTLPVDPHPGIGRPHVARAIAAITDHDVAWAFDELIGDDGPCYVPRDVPSFEDGRRLLAEASPVVGLAHPLRYPDPGAALERAETLDAVERYYPYERSPAGDPAADVDLAAVDRCIERHDLLPTGGSDAHDETLGVAGLDRTDTERFLAALESQ